MSYYQQCWTDGTGTRTAKGYRRVEVDGVAVYVHRLSFFLHYGYWPNVCRHRCDNPPCYNPTHLEDGSHADNVADRVARGRTFKLNHGMPRYDDRAAYQREKRRRVRNGTWIKGDVS